MFLLNCLVLEPSPDLICSDHLVSGKWLSQPLKATAHNDYRFSKGFFNSPTLPGDHGSLVPNIIGKWNIRVVYIYIIPGTLEGLSGRFTPFKTRSTVGFQVYIILCFNLGIPGDFLPIN